MRDIHRYRAETPNISIPQGSESPRNVSPPHPFRTLANVLTPLWSKTRRTVSTSSTPGPTPPGFATAGPSEDDDELAKSLKEMFDRAEEWPQEAVEEQNFKISFGDWNDLSSTKRWKRLEILKRQEPETLKKYVNPIVTALKKEENGSVLAQILMVMQKLPPETLATHAETVRGKADTNIAFVRSEVIKTLSKLGDTQKNSFLPFFVTMIKDRQGYVRKHALNVIETFDKATLRTIDAKQIVDRLTDTYVFARISAFSVILKLDIDQLRPHKEQIANFVRENDSLVETKGVELLEKLKTEDSDKD